MKPVGLFLILNLICTPLAAQIPAPATDGTDHVFGAGFLHQGFYKFSPKWGAFTDIQFRMDEKVQFSYQNVLRGAMMYSVKPKLNVLGGYAYVTTYSETFQQYFPEHRIWQQLVHWQKPGPWLLVYRIRTEQRFVQNLQRSANNDVEAGDYRYGNRMRFYTRAIYHFNQKPEKRNVFFVAAHDEFFVNFASPELNKNLFDQNRVFLACGILIDQHTRLEFGYVNTYLNPYQRRNIMVHSLNFVVLQNLNFSMPTP